MTKKRIGVLTSGGDCPGLNAVLRGIYCSAEQLGWEVLGFLDGFEGMLPEGGDFMMLTRSNTAGILQTGGTILGTTNKGHFTSKIAGGERTVISEEVIARASRTCRDLDLTAIIAIGGDGSMNTCLQLYRAGFPMIGVPKTIDNDLEATAMTFGFDSAAACVTDALDRLHTTAASHKRVFVVQVMGRHAGWIALWGGLAGAADIILIPEIPFCLEKISEEVHSRDREGFKSTMIVVAEGARAQHGQQFRKQSASGEWKLGGVGEMLVHEIESRTGKETRGCVLGHLQRGGDPTTLDRILGTQFGVKAVQLASEEKFGVMVSYQNYEVHDVPIAEAIHRLKRVPSESQLIETARAVGIRFGD